MHRNEQQVKMKEEGEMCKRKQLHGGRWKEGGSTTRDLTHSSPRFHAYVICHAIRFLPSSVDQEKLRVALD